MWAHGGTLASRKPRDADLDTYVIVARRPDASTVEAIEHAPRRDRSRSGRRLGHAGTSLRMTPGAPSRHRMPSATAAGTRHGQSIGLIGWLDATGSCMAFRPTEIVPAPTWPEILAELDESWSTSKRTSPRVTPIPTRPRTRSSTAAASSTQLETRRRRHLEARGWRLGVGRPAGPMAPAPPGCHPELPGACDAERRRAPRGRHGALCRHGPRAPPRRRRAISR